MTIATEEQLPSPTDLVVEGQQPENLDLILDVDARELREAQIAAKAEQAAATGETEPGVTGVKPEATSAEPKTSRAPRAPMIPKPRLDEVSAQRDEALATAAHWRAIAEARGTPSPGPAAPAPAQTPEQQLATIDQRVDALAKKFDDGELTMTDYKRQERELTRQADAIREDALVAKVRPQQAARSEDFGLEAATEELASQHPWLDVFEQVGKDADWNYLRDNALANLRERGIQPKSDGTATSRERYELRAEIARLADDLGPGIVGKRAEAKGIVLPGQTAAPAPAAPPLSQQAQARQTKLNVRSSAPPDITSLTGSRGPATGEVSDAAIEAMTDEEIAALPRAVKDRLLGTSP